MINITVVADKDLSYNARRLVHLLAKTSQIKSVFVSPEIHKQNEMQAAGNNYTIFLGKTDVSESYLDLIKVDYDKCGVKWGHDYRKALIYVDNSIFVSADMLKQELNKVKGSVYFERNVIFDRDKRDSLFKRSLLVKCIVLLSKLHQIDYNSLLKLKYELGISTFLLDKKGLSAFMDEK